MKAIIIDDESSGRKAVRNYISKYATNIEILDEADSVKNGLFSILTHKPDLVFLDIRMPDGTGFDLLEKLPEINFQVIFVTAYEQHAIKAFKYSAVDYLLKPINPDDFIAAVSKVESKNKLQEIEHKVELLIQNNQKFEKIALPSSSGLKMVAISDIVRCESDNNYTLFHFKDQSQYLASRTLKEYDELLSSDGFYRTHKSHLVNLKYVSEYVKGEGGFVILEDGKSIDVSRRKKEGLIQILSQQN
jgi:two-component system LytT family response regulator